MFPDKDLGNNSNTISNSRKHQQNTAAVRLLDIVGICKPDTLSLTKVADNIVTDVQGKCKEVVHSVIRRSSTASYASHPVSGAIPPSLAIHPHPAPLRVGTFAVSLNLTFKILSPKRDDK